jgi:predicted nucleic acid-binding protein
MGVSVDRMDLLIAATALVFDVVLVTHNRAHFEKISNLRIEDWLAP